MNYSTHYTEQYNSY